MHAILQTHLKLLLLHYVKIHYLHLQHWLHFLDDVRNLRSWWSVTVRNPL